MNENNNSNDMVKNVTIHELAELLGEEYLVVSSLVKFMVKNGIAKEVGKRPNPAGQRGKPASIYEIPNEATLVFWEDTTDETTGETTDETTATAEPVVEPVVEPVAETVVEQTVESPSI